MENKELLLKYEKMLDFDEKTYDKNNKKIYRDYYGEESYLNIEIDYNKKEIYFYYDDEYGVYRKHKIIITFYEFLAIMKYLKDDELKEAKILNEFKEV